MLSDMKRAMNKIDKVYKITIVHISYNFYHYIDMHDNFHQIISECFFRENK
jgi:hypothetical protein